MELLWTGSRTRRTPEVEVANRQATAATDDASRTTRTVAVILRPGAVHLHA